MNYHQKRYISIFMEISLTDKQKGEKDGCTEDL